MDCRNIQEAINFIEENILNDINYDEIAKNIYSSSFHFRRAFSMITGITVGEYIRNRKLSIAGQEIFTTKAKIIDVAFKYGYECVKIETTGFCKQFVNKKVMITKTRKFIFKRAI